MAHGLAGLCLFRLALHGQRKRLGIHSMIGQARPQIAVQQTAGLVGTDQLLGVFFRRERPSAAKPAGRNR